MSGGTKGKLFRTRATAILLLLGVSLLVSCSEPSPQTDTPTRKAGPKEALHALYMEARDRAMEWNQAVDTQNEEHLKSLYAAEVRLYGDTISREELMKRKRKLFADYPDYRQSAFYWFADSPAGEFPPERIRVNLGLKEYMPTDTPFFNAHLVFEVAEGQWTIVEESDWMTDLQRDRNSPGKPLTDGQYCLEWREQFDAEKIDSVHLVRDRVIKSKFSVEEGQATDGFLFVRDEKYKQDREWQIIGGKHGESGEFVLDLLRVEIADGPPVDPQSITLKTQNGEVFVIVASDTRLDQTARLTRINCD